MPGLPAPVSNITKQGANRVVTDTQGHSLVISKRKLKTAFNSALAEHQRQIALKTVRETRSHRATVMLGGVIRGQKHSYVSKSAAIAAVNRRYDQAPNAKGRRTG